MIDQSDENGMFLTCQHATSRRHAIVDQSEGMIYFWLTEPESGRGVMGCPLYSTVPPPEAVDWELIARTGQSPPIMSDVASSEAVLANPVGSEFSAIWSPDGHSVAVVRGGRIVGMIVANATQGYSRALAKESAIGLPFDEALAMRTFPGFPPNLAETRRLVEQGDAEAQCSLGIMYHEGNGVPQDAARAVEWYRKAAEQGDAKAQFNLGGMYFRGEGVVQDAARAVEWYRKAAEQGLAQAQFNLGFMYAEGVGVPQDAAKAAECYRKAAEQGIALAQGNLGYMYAEGEGVPQDVTKAVEWYRKAAEQGLAQAQFDLGGMYREGVGVPVDFILAYVWMYLSAAQGHVGAAKQSSELEGYITGKEKIKAQELINVYADRMKKNQ